MWEEQSNNICVRQQDENVRMWEEQLNNICVGQQDENVRMWEEQSKNIKMKTVQTCDLGAPL